MPTIGRSVRFNTIIWIGTYQAGREGLEYAASKGLGMVIMEPLRGGKLALAEQIPEKVQTIWDSAPEKRSPAEWALRWVWNHPEVSTALSGMNSMAQLKENLKIAEEGRAHSLSAEDLALIDRVTETYQKMLTIDCTSCSYCLPCPQGVNIPHNFRLYNDHHMFKDQEINFLLYNRMTAPEQRASNCSECGECEERCPQQIKISEGVKKGPFRFESLGREMSLFRQLHPARQSLFPFDDESSFSAKS